MPFTYTYSNPTVSTNLSDLRFLLGDHRGVPAAYADAAAWLANSRAMFTDEELNRCLALAANETNKILFAARLAMTNRVNREAMSAGVAGTTDTSDRPSALATALHEMERLGYPGQQTLPTSTSHTEANLDRDDLAP